MTVVATSVPAAPAPLEVRDVPIVSIFASPTNPRKSIDQAKIEELAQSIRAVGIQVPLTLRATADGFEIVGGERRYRAAKLLAMTFVPAIVREMTDEECREAQLIENLQREDLDALDEADAYAGLLDALGSVQAIAAKSGKSIEHVTRVLKLRTLIPFSRQALAGKLITVDHALLLAKLADAEQEKALRYVLDRNATRKQKTEELIAASLKNLQRDGNRWGYWEPQSVLDLKTFIEQDIKLDLKRAPWDLADAELLSAAGACTSCPKNTAHNVALFGDLAIEEAVCTDAACFNAKRDAFVQLQLKAVAAAGKDAVRISWKRTSSKPRSADFSQQAVAEGNITSKGVAFYSQIFKDGQWVEAKTGSCPTVRTGVTVDFEESTYGSVDAKKKPGRKLLVCVSPGCKVHKKEWEKPAPSNSSGGYDHKAEEEKRRKRAEAVAEENRIRLGLAKQAIDKVTKISEGCLRMVLIDAARHSTPQLLADLKSAEMGSSKFAKAVAGLALLKSGLELCTWSSPETERPEFLATLKTLGVDGSSAWAKKPEPKAAPKKAAPAKPAKKKAVAKKAAKKGGR